MSIVSHGHGYRGVGTWAGLVPRFPRAALWPLLRGAAVQLCLVALAVFLLTNLQDRTETITVALLGLAYASLRASAIGHGCALQRMASEIERELKGLRRSLPTGTDGRAESSAEACLAAANAAQPAWVDYLGLAAIAAICLYHLCVAIFFGMAYEQLLGLH